MKAPVTTPIHVVLADDHLVVRAGLLALLKLEPGIEVLGEASDGREAVALAETLRPHVVVMDIAMPLLNGMEATRQILRASPSIRVLILSAYSDDAYIERFIELGAAGFLAKQSAAHLLPEAIRAVLKSKGFFCPREADSTVRSPIKPFKPSALLTSREMEVLQLVAEGKANKESANLLHISIKTVEKHRQTLMEKLNIHETAGLTRYAIANGIIESGVRGKIK